MMSATRALPVDTEVARKSPTGAEEKIVAIPQPSPSPSAQQQQAQRGRSPEREVKLAMKADTAAQQALTDKETSRRTAIVGEWSSERRGHMIWWDEQSAFRSFMAREWKSFCREAKHHHHQHHQLLQKQHMLEQQEKQEQKQLKHNEKKRIVAAPSHCVTKTALPTHVPTRVNAVGNRGGDKNESAVSLATGALARYERTQLELQRVRTAFKRQQQQQQSCTQRAEGASSTQQSKSSILPFPAKKDYSDGKLLMSSQLEMELRKLIEFEM